MSWFKLSDDWIDHPKARRAGRDGRDLWIAAGNRCARYNTDGLVELELLKDYAALAEVRSHSATAKRLVEVGLWHDHESFKKCKSCKDDLALVNAERRVDDLPLLVVRPGDHYFHQWLKHQPPKKAKQSVAAKRAEDRNRDLSKDRGLCEAIQERDGDRCRYCGHRVDWKDRRGRHGATYDHVDPDCYEPHGGNYLDAVVTACRECNGRKGHRTPAEWAADGGLLLSDPWIETQPTDRTDGAPSTTPSDSDSRARKPDPRPDRDQVAAPSEPGSGSGSPSRSAQLGSGQVGARSDLAPGRAGLGLVGSGLAGPGLAGLGRPGSGALPCPDQATTRDPELQPQPTTDATSPALAEGATP